MNLMVLRSLIFTFAKFVDIRKILGTYKLLKMRMFAIGKDNILVYKISLPL